MSKNLADLRFAIRNASGQVSCIWRLWATRHGDVYLAARNMAKIEKYSFHKSGVCRSAFTSEYGAPKTMTDRAMFKWRRLSTPAAGESRGSRVAWIAFPTDYLSSPSGLVVKDVAWIEAAPAGGATYIEVVFTRESPERVHRAFRERQERDVLTYLRLPSEEALFVCSYHADWENKDLRMPGEGKVADLVFSSRDPHDTGRPVRIRFGPAPCDGDALVLQELGGYPVHAGPKHETQGAGDEAARPQLALSELR